MIHGRMGDFAAEVVTALFRGSNPPGVAMFGGASAMVLLACGCSASAPAAKETQPATSPSAVATSSLEPIVALPDPPKDARLLQRSERVEAQYARYRTGRQTPEQVIAFYEAELRAAGYSLVSARVEGGGWGKWGGSEAGLTASRGRIRADVQAGDSRRGPTYFEVCVGEEASSVARCENLSQGLDSESSGS